MDPIEALQTKSWDLLRAQRPFADAWHELCDLLAEFQPKRAALASQFAEWEFAVAETVSALRAQWADEPPPDDINGLWFGMFEAERDPEEAADAEDDSSVIRLYCGGSDTHEPEAGNPDWGSDLAWWPQGRHLDVSLLDALSTLQPPLEEHEEWLIYVNAFMEGVVMLMVADALRDLGPDFLLGRTPARAVGGGFDMDVGREFAVITREGLTILSEDPLAASREAFTYEEDQDPDADYASEEGAAADADDEPLPVSDERKRIALIEKIEALEEEGDVWVQASEFLNGNEDLGSIGCNLEPHPGLAAFRDVVRRVSLHPSVIAVYAEITDMMDELDEDSWPFSESLIVLTSESDEQVMAWFSPLMPDEVYDYDGDPPSYAPEAPEDCRWVRVWWD